MIEDTLNASDTLAMKTSTNSQNTSATSPPCRTPRTDSESYYDPTPGYEVVSANFARILEEELTAVTEQRDRLAEALESIIGEAAFEGIPESKQQFIYEALQSLNQPDYEQRTTTNRRWMRRLVRWGWFACFLGNYEWYRRLYGGLWAHVHIEEPCYSCMWLNCPAGADESYREGNWRGTPEFRNYDPANAGGMARELAAQDSESPTNVNG